MKKVFLTYLILSATVILSACSGPPLTLKPGADKIKLTKNEPPEGFEYVGYLRAVDGEGCGAFGYKGQKERAEIILRNNAIDKGANFVKIDDITVPHLEPGCFDNDYTITGSAYIGTIILDPAAEKKLAEYKISEKYQKKLSKCEERKKNCDSRCLDRSMNSFSNTLSAAGTSNFGAVNSQAQLERTACDSQCSGDYEQCLSEAEIF